MKEPQEPTLPEVGVFKFELHSSRRSGRPLSSEFRLHCDAVAVAGDELLLSSVAGPETSVKALTAGLRSSGKDQQRIDYRVHVGNVERHRLEKSVDGYRILRTKLDFGHWHVLILAERPDFLPVLTEESLWRLLQSEAYTTPLLRDWIPWLYHTMENRGLLFKLAQHGCQAGLLRCDGDKLDALVSEGLRCGHLDITGSSSGGSKSRRDEIQTLDQYLVNYGPILGKQAERSLDPLHVPGRDSLPNGSDLLRTPFGAQSHVIEATRKALRKQKSILVVGEMGTGKTLMGMAGVHAHAGAMPYRALVFCPDSSPASGNVSSARPFRVLGSSSSTTGRFSCSLTGGGGRREPNGTSSPAIGPSWDASGNRLTGRASTMVASFAAQRVGAGWSRKTASR
jgi:hypothetical protein